MSAIAPIPHSENETHDLLRATIVADSQHRYAVTFRSGAERMTDDLFVRFALHYYARVLYELSHRDHSVRNLPALIERIAGAPRSANLFDAAGISGGLITEAVTPAGESRVALRRVGIRSFDLAGNVEMTGMALAYSMLAVLQSVLQHTAPVTRTAVMTALVNMNASYTMTHRYADAASLHEVPAIAYLAAAFADDAPGADDDRDVHFGGLFGNQSSRA